MKRFHVHICVNSLPDSIEFYSKLFGKPPVKQKGDYAKWMLDDPRINFAISARSDVTGLDHFGFQVDDENALTELEALARSAAGEAILEEGRTNCCYANSEKHWTVDPQGLPWEHFMTMGEAREYGGDRDRASGNTENRERSSDAATNACCG